MSRYDIEIASSGDADRALWMAKHLVTNHVSYFGEKVKDCNQLPQQQTLFAPEPAAQVSMFDSYLEAAYEDQQSGMEDF